MVLGIIYEPKSENHQWKKRFCNEMYQLYSGADVGIVAIQMRARHPEWMMIL
jgi:hypothetical protein